MNAVALPRGRGGDSPTDQLPEPRTRELDVADGVLRARLRAGLRQPRQAGMFDGVLAADAISSALVVASRGVGAAVLDDRPSPVPVKRITRHLCGWLWFVIGLGLLTAMVRLTFREVTVEDWTLLAGHGADTYSGQEPVAALGRTLRRYGLRACGALPDDQLAAVRDVAVVHAGGWYNIRVARAERFDDGHVWFQGADGSGLRVRGDRVLLRLGWLEDEEAVAAADVAAPDTGAYFEVVVPIAAAESGGAV